MDNGSKPLTWNLFSLQEEIQRQQKITEDLEDIITKIRRVCIYLETDESST